MKTKEEILQPIIGNLHPSSICEVLEAMEEYAKAYYEDKKQPISHVDKAYVIGVSDEENIYSYCLGRNINGSFEVILCKAMIDEYMFKEEVANLSKYFNAPILHEK